MVVAIDTGLWVVEQIIMDKDWHQHFEVDFYLSIYSQPELIANISNYSFLAGRPRR